MNIYRDTLAVGNAIASDAAFGIKAMRASALPDGCTTLAPVGDPIKKRKILEGYGDVRDANEMRMRMARQSPQIETRRCRAAQ